MARSRSRCSPPRTSSCSPLPPDEIPDDDDCRLLAEWLERRGASFVRDIVAGTGIPHERVLTALWRLAAAGWTTNDSWSTLRAGARSGSTSS
jgi:hypothetical protein